MANYNIVLSADLHRIIDSKKSLNMDIAIDRGIKNGLTEFKLLVELKLKENLESFGLSNLSKQVRVYKVPEGLRVTINEGTNDYAIYVEYGTGIVGENNPHPDPSRENWIYDINEYGDSGWWYPTDKDDPNPTKYLGENGWWAWTAGQASRPFMYNTWLWARQSFNNVISKHIAKEIKKEMKKFKGG